MIEPQRTHRRNSSEVLRWEGFLPQTTAVSAAYSLNVWLHLERRRCVTPSCFACVAATSVAFVQDMC
ncbi:hypothetical protein [Nostoc sp. FACHB-110]|uniref:hypothetical protein n=1 Tax=Nostoc sp. FACHB-110 TaxID=2692834 RepID=UPI001A7E46EB|nr:hypothetical protein [Nostoc sp. FACHB-110]